jgi:Tol biopolymer transport system component
MVSAIVFILFTKSENIFAQDFGKNKVQYKSFEWYYIQSSHFDIHFYKGGEKLAEFVAEVAESALVQIENDWKYKLKSRVPIIVYNSHNDFQQTNVIEEYLEEGVGGVTEMFKNRITIPYEGSYSQLRHVTHHELTHAVMFDMFYGGMFPRSIYTASMFQIPLWVAEGIAEYESVGWNTDTDRYNRDATINGYLEYSKEVYNVYWGGNLIFHFIADKYGKEKVGDFINKLRQTNNVDRGLKSAFGLDYEELMEQWSLYARRRYWPDIADRKKPEEIANRLTDHKKLKNFYNISPAISPDGSKIAFTSDKSGYFDIYVMSAIDGKILSKVIRGQKSADFEEMHILSPGISWSPDGKNIAFAAKSGKEDALYVVNVRSGSVRQFRFGLDGVFGAEWSPNSNEIAFIGNQDGASDIYSYDVTTKKLRKITDDIFSEKHPSWSPDGKKITFVSDRRNYVPKEMIPDDFEIHNFDYNQWDVYIINEDGTNMERITETEYDEDYPVWSPDGKSIACATEKNGISNIFIIDTETKEARPITNTLTGCEQLSWSKDGTKLVFSSFSNMGYDIYMIKNPLEIDSKNIELKNTVYFDELEKKKKEEERPVKNLIASENETKLQSPGLANYVFDRNLSDKNQSILQKTKIAEIKSQEDISKEEKNKYQIKKYKLKFSPDIVTGSAGYDRFFGVQGTSIIQITDILGDHQIFIGTDLYFDLRNSNYFLQYRYLPRRTDYSIGIFQDSMYFTGYYQFLGLPVGSVPFRLRNFGIQTFGSRPFSKFSRIDFGAIYSNIDQTYFYDYGDIPTIGVKTFLFSLSFSNDTSLWGPNFFPIIPLDGTRYNFFIYTSPPLSNRSFNPYPDPYSLNEQQNGTLSFTTVNADIRKYFKIRDQYGFAFRMSGGGSFGRDPENFYLGGIDNWLNREFVGDIRDGLRDIFFSHYITPLRGAGYYQLVGSKYFLGNVEFRFPLIQYLLLGWPLPIGFQQIRGSLFFDVGGAWDPYEEFDSISGKWIIGDPFKSNYEVHKGFRATKKINGVSYFDDMAMSWGIGARGILLFFLARFDVAWLHDGNKFSSPNYLFSLGFDF